MLELDSAYAVVCYCVTGMYGREVEGKVKGDRR